jgi:iron complex outermembrane receptor protein
VQTFHRQILGIGLALIWSNACTAQPSDEEDLALAYGDKDTVSIATGSRQALRRAPSVASVITAEDIKNMGAHDLDEVMEAIPGVHVTRSASSYFSGYIIRGIGGNPSNPQVLMLQNGLPTSSVWRGDRGQSLGAPLLENIARIEIIRGPGSALYGADAFSGVVNIITKSAESAPGTELGTRVGSFNSKNAWIQHGGQHGTVDVAAYLQVDRTNGNKEIVSADAATRLNKALGGTSSFAPGPLNTGADVIDAQIDLGYNKWRLRGGYKSRTQGTGAGITYALDPIGKEKTEHLNADLSWTDAQFARNWGLGFTGNYLQQIEDNTYVMFPPGTKLPAQLVTNPAVAALLGISNNTNSPSGTFPNGMMGSPGRWERQFRASGYATYTGFADHSLRFALGHEDLNLYQVRTLKNFWLSAAGIPVPTGAVIDYSSIQPHQLTHRRFNDYFTVQDEWSLAHDWSLTAGVRRDGYSDFGNTTNPRLALVWDAAYDFTAKLLYGQAFRAPSFNEQYGVNPSGDGNPNVKPERIKTMETAFSWQVRRDTQFNLNLFQYNMKDAIRAVAKPGGVGLSFQNTGQLHGNGLELEAVWDASRNLRLSGNYSRQQSIDETTNTDAGYAPHNHVFAKADWRFADSWMLSPQIDWVADRRRVKGDTRAQVPDYTSVDITLHNTLNKANWSFAASVRNLFNVTTLEPTLYLAPPGNLLTYPTSAIPNDLPMAPRAIWLQAMYKL